MALARGGSQGAGRDVELILIQLEQNQGRSIAANTGLQAATGRYLCFLDDDDRFLPDHIELLSSCLEHIEHRVCYSDAELCWQVYNVETGEFDIVNRQVFGSRDFNLAELLCGNYIPLNTLLFDRQVLLQVGGSIRSSTFTKIGTSCCVSAASTLSITCLV